MTTNIIATMAVFLTTNTTDIFPSHLEFDGAASSKEDALNGIGGSCVMREVPDPNPTTKQVVSHVTQHTVYTLSNGSHFEEMSNVSSSTQYFKLHSEWLADTNPPKASDGWTFGDSANPSLYNFTNIPIGFAFTNAGFIYTTNSQ